MMSKTCTDPVVGAILSSWRYDISGISPQMRVDYEQHLEGCSHCHARQRLHRTVDVVLIAVSTVSILAFLMVLALIHHMELPQSRTLLDLRLGQRDIVLTLQAAAIAGLLISLMAWILVAIATPAPVYLTDMALAQARFFQDGQTKRRNAA